MAALRGGAVSDERYYSGVLRGRVFLMSEVPLYREGVAECACRVLGFRGASLIKKPSPWTLAEIPLYDPASSRDGFCGAESDSAPVGLVDYSSVNMLGV